jgi:acetolactate synthase-1/2/3 large subunit
VRRDQEQLFEGRVLGAKLRNPDFVALAESFGMRGYRAGTPESLRSALDQALASSAPALIEIPIDYHTECSPWEFLMPPSRSQG